MARSFYSALKAELEALEAADLDRRGRVDDGNWRGRLDELHAHHGTWQRVADDLGVDKRTLERWRKGYAPRGGGPRRQVSPAGIVPKVRDAIARTLPARGDRRAQVARPDWRKLFIVGTIKWENYERTQNMHLGKYLTPASFEAIADVYVKRGNSRMPAAIDHAISTDYLGFPVHLADTQELRF